jgi:hypothetical protein
MPHLMDYHLQNFKYNFAAKAILLLAAILMTACRANTPSPDPLAVVVTATPTDTPPPTATPVLRPQGGTEAPTHTPRPATPTPMLTSTPTFTATPTPTKKIPSSTATPTLEATPSPVVEKSSTGSRIKVYETSLTLLTYPIWDYLVEEIDPIYNIPVYYFDRQAFEDANPSPTPIDYTGVVLENPYLRLTFLPELGGRLYSALIKSTGQEIFYHNEVVKPSRYGVLDPYEANWWLGAGGMEWAYPTQEHGYRWGVPWDYEITQTASNTTITLSDTAPNRVGAEIKVTLPANRAVFTVIPQLTNAGSDTVPVQFWLNAALALDPDSMSPKTQFIVPTDKVIVHSRGESGWTVPETHHESPWPQVGETNLSDYSQWANYLGFFVPNMEAPFMAAYNPETKLGVVRLIEPGAVPGNKLFAFGPAFPDRSYTDDGSQYFEIWGGVNTGFWPEDDINVPSGDTLQWQEQWWPVTGLDGITWANEHAVIHLTQSSDTYHLSLLVSRPRQGKLIVSAAETLLLSESFSADPAAPLQWDFAISDLPPLRVQLMDHSGETLLDHTFDVE